MTDLSNISTSTVVGEQATRENKGTGQDQLFQDYEMFMSLLTTQLQNQDPTDPMDTDEMTNQLVQYSQVEQAVLTNSKMDELIEQGGSSGNVEYLDNIAHYQGNEIQKLTDTADIYYRLGGSAQTVTATIMNAEGRVVDQIDLSGKTTGAHVQTWDGLDGQGNQLPAGTYSVDIRATNSSGNAVNVTTEGYGIVTEADFTGTQPTYTVNGQTVSEDDILRVRTPYVYQS
jgi:flagellar basal-body rod modification protein FlgD